MLQRSLVETAVWARQVAHPIVWSVITLLVAVILAMALALAAQGNQHPLVPVPSPTPPIEHQAPGHVRRV
jgi:hypothetical protein